MRWSNSRSGLDSSGSKEGWVELHGWMIDGHAGVNKDGFLPSQEGRVFGMPQDVGFIPDGSSTSHGGLCQDRVNISVLAIFLVFSYSLEIGRAHV